MPPHDRLKRVALVIHAMHIHTDQIMRTHLREPIERNARKEGLVDWSIGYTRFAPLPSVTFEWTWRS